MSQTYFITGTDTEVGKTYVTCCLLKAAARAGKRVVGYKPVSAGCDWINGQWQNEDARAMLDASNVDVSITEINPIAYEPAIAPHIAGQLAGQLISEETIVNGLQLLQAKGPDLVLMEGAGGWRLPIGSQRFLSDVVQSLALDVVLVVGMRLGCLNHALLTAEAILADGLRIRGWIANRLSDDMPYYQENLATLKEAMPAPFLAEIPYQTAPDWNELAQILS